jgi:hypothetical protein
MSRVSIPPSIAAHRLQIDLMSRFPVGHLANQNLCSSPVASWKQRDLEIGWKELLTRRGGTWMRVGRFGRETGGASGKRRRRDAGG